MSNFEEFESQLGLVQNKIRLEILHVLLNSGHPLEFHDILNQLTTADRDSSKLSYHLKGLKDDKFIIKDGSKYYLTPYGVEIAHKLDEMNQIVQSKSGAILIRTSRYTQEPFDVSKIARTLIKEAEMPQELAHQVANEAKKRLEAAKVTYLTAPLIREIINAILIESHHEDYRHKLTRLGLPPYDIQQMLSIGQVESCSHLRQTLGQAAIEQFVLLNQLPQRYADLILTGTCHLFNLEAFSTVPIEIVLTGKSFAAALNEYLDLTYRQGDYIDLSQVDLVNLKNRSKSPSFIEEIGKPGPKSHAAYFKLPFLTFIRHLGDFLRLIACLFPQGLTIYSFEDFLSVFFASYPPELLSELIWNGFTPPIPSYPIRLQLSLDANYSEITPLFILYLQSFQYPITEWSKLPVLQLHFPKTKLKFLQTEDLANKRPELIQMALDLAISHQVDLDQYVVWGMADSGQVYTPSQASIIIDDPKSFHSGLVVENISINLPKVALEVKGNESDFLVKLEKVIYSAIDLFEQKYRSLSENLPKLQSWQIFSSCLYEKENAMPFERDITQYSGLSYLYCAVGVYGLDDAVSILTGLSIKEQISSTQLAGKIIAYIQRLLKKQSELHPRIQYVYAEPVPQSFSCTPQDATFSSVNEFYTNKGRLVRPYYAMIMHLSENPQNLKKLMTLYQKMSTEVKGLSCECYISVNNSRKVTPVAFIVKNLFNTGIQRLSFSQIYEFKLKTHSTPELPSKNYYTRYYGRYFMQNPKYPYNNFLFTRKDKLEWQEE